MIVNYDESRGILSLICDNDIEYHIYFHPPGEEIQIYKIRNGHKSNGHWFIESDIKYDYLNNHGNEVMQLTSLIGNKIQRFYKLYCGVFS